MQTVTNPFQALKDIFVKPNQVFATVATTHNWSWIPFFVISISAALPVYYYFSVVDFAWYTDMIIQTSAGDLSPAELDMMRRNFQQSPIQFISIASVIFSSIVANAVIACYLLFVSRADEECVQGFTDWYGFTWWVSMPSVIFNLLAVLVILAASDNQISPESLSPTSLAFIFGIGMESNWFTLTQAIRFESIWVMYLLAVGLSQWTKLPAKRTYIIATAPFILIWTIWAAIILFS